MSHTFQQPTSESVEQDPMIATTDCVRQTQPEEQHQWTFTEDPRWTFDPAQNTHLWLVFQGAKLAANDPVYGSAIVKTILPSDSYINDAAHIFHNALCQGIWDADEKAPYNGPEVPAIGQPTYLHHFYDPDTHRNYLGYKSPTAYTEAVAYFHESIRFWSAHNFQDAGYFLGLALHFFTDVTQPMHSSNYINGPNYDGLSFNHKNFEEFANTLIGDYIWNGSQPPLYPLDSGDQPGAYVDIAAKESKSFCFDIVKSMDSKPLSWQPSLKPVIINKLFWNATARTAQFLRVWMMHAQKAWNQNGDDRITISGPMTLSCYKGSRPFDQQVDIYGIDQGGVLNEVRWDANLRGSWKPVTTIQRILLDGVNLQDGSMSATHVPNSIYLNHVFTVTDTNHLLRTSYHRGFFDQWEDLGVITADPSQLDSAQAASLVAIQGHNPIDLFCISAKGNLLHGCTDGNFTWQGWQNLGGANEAGLINELYRLEDGKPNNPTFTPRVSSLAACKRIDQPDFMDVFAISQDGSLMQKCWNGSQWLGWNRVGRPSDGGGLRVQAGSLCCIVRDPNGKANDLDVFAISVEGHLLHAFWANDRWYWQDLQGTTLGNGLAGSIVVSNVYNPLDVLAVTTDGFIIHKVWNGKAWQDWVRFI
ncbi:MAG: hypothetical protein HC866_22695 [Leptolyngbyaceae cyanobacterium RU_5_1]|nr:hypothetical protein [Leptolyngbyaceae cyanobacterium RU_5_1]